MSATAASAIRMISSAPPSPAAELPIGPARSTIGAATEMVLAVTPGVPAGGVRHPGVAPEDDDAEPPLTAVSDPPGAPLAPGEPGVVALPVAATPAGDPGAAPVPVGTVV